MNTNTKITREEALRLLNDPIFRAYAEGCEVEYESSIAINNWFPVTDGSTFSIGSKHRIKPTPTLRPWKPEEVPVGALIRRKHNPSVETVILAASITSNFPRIIVASPAFESASTLFINDLMTYHGGHNGDAIEHSLDHGKTWLPCGVMEDK